MGWFAAGFFAGVAIAIVAEAVVLAASLEWT